MAATDPVTALEQEMGVLLRRARALSWQIAREVHPDLDPGMYAILARLADTGGARASDLAAYFGVGKPTMSRQVAVVERLGLVDRTPDPDDARAALLRLSEDGARSLDRVRGARRRRLRELLADWPDTEVRQLAGLLRRFNTGIATREQVPTAE